MTDIQDFDPTPPVQPTEMVEGLTYHQREDGIIVYRFKKLSRSTADAFHKLIKHNDAIAHKSGTHIRSLIDGRGLLPGPYFMAKAVNLGNETPDDLVESIAIVSGDNLTTSMLRTFIRRMPKKVRDSIQFFRSDEQAIAWLDERKELMNEFE